MSGRGAAPGAGAPRRVALLAPMRQELGPLVRRLGLRRRAGPDPVFAGRRGAVEVVARLSGIGTRAAARAAEAALDAGGLDRVVVVGIAGGVAPELALGELIVPEVVVDLASGAVHRPAPLGGATPRGALATSDRLIGDPEELASLARRGILAIDMETAAVAAVCEARGCPWSVFRAISDRADGSVDPEILALAGPDGRGDLRAVARFAATRPWRLPQLVRLARGTRRAAEAAARAAARAIGEA